MSKRGKRRGRFCWCCGRIRANERFSGRGHAGHLCKDCARLGPVEIAFRQAVRHIDSMVDWDGVIRRKHRTSFERFLSHPDARVRQFAREVAAAHARALETCRRERSAREADELAFEAEADARDVVRGTQGDLDVELAREDF